MVFTIVDFFALDETADGDFFEILQKKRKRVLYLFRCHDLLPEGYRIAIDEQRGIVGVYHDQKKVLLKTIPVNAVEIAVLTLLLSSPWSVDTTQIQNVRTLYQVNDTLMEETKNNDAMSLLSEFVRAYNQKLKKLHLAIAAIDEYRLITISEDLG